ncbi:hypothetical protein BaRGS_00028107, partial [Batillaria attramentaria]
MAASVTLPRLEQISQRVIRVLGCNPGNHTLQGTNTYLIGNRKKARILFMHSLALINSLTKCSSDKSLDVAKLNFVLKNMTVRRILIDTGEPNIPEYISQLKGALAKFSVSIQEIVVTHWHADHVGGVDDICRTFAQNKPLQETDYSFINDQQTFSTEGATLRVHHNPGHTEDHIILQLLEDNAVFSGDTILGGSTTIVEDLHSYMQSLQQILNLKPSVIYPGHGYVIDNPTEVVQGYIKHRLMREQQILECLTANRQTPMTAMDIVKVVYVGVSEALYPSAANNVTQHLLKLEKEKIV